MRHLRKRLTYANVMSSIAVFLVIGGATALAALPKNSVGTKQLKKNAVNSAKVKNDSLTGADINESTLGTVPSATNASNATNATNAANATNATNAAHASSADTVGGSTIKKIFYAENSTTAQTTILSLDGLTLTASCPAGEPLLIATTSVDNSLIHAGGAFLLPEPWYVEDDDFDVGEEIEVLEEEPDSVEGTINYAQPSGTVVSVVFQSEENAFSGFNTDCVISGHAIG